MQHILPIRGQECSIYAYPIPRKKQKCCIKISWYVRSSEIERFLYFQKDNIANHRIWQSEWIGRDKKASQKSAQGVFIEATGQSLLNYH
jgi:hypothetical protein